MITIRVKDLQTWKRIKIFECPIELLELIIAKILEPSENALTIRIERISTREKDASLVGTEVLNNCVDRIGDTLTILKENGITHVAVWMQVEVLSVEALKSTLTQADYEFDYSAEES